MAYVYVPGRKISRRKEQRGREYDVRVHGRCGPHGSGGRQGQLIVVRSDKRVKARERGKCDQLDSGQGRRHGGHATAHGSASTTATDQQLPSGNVVASRGIHGAL